MIAESLARRYASALFNLSSGRDEIEQINEEFQTLIELVSSKDKFRHFLFSPKVDAEQKKKELQIIFGETYSKTLMHFLFLLIDKKRQTIIIKIQEHFVSLYNNFHKKAEITVRPAVKLDDEVKSNIQSLFEKKLERNVDIKEEVDPSLIGGFQVRVNNTVYDATVLNKLNKMRKVLVSG